MRLALLLSMEAIKEKSFFTTLIEASMEELLSMATDLQLTKNSSLSFYRNVLMAYLNCDISALKKLEQESAAHPTIIHQLTKLRCQIRERKIDTHFVAFVIDSFPQLQEEWFAEAAFVVAMAFETCDEPARANEFYRLASALLGQIGAHRKSVKAHFNAIVAESRLYPEKKFLTEYRFLYKKALRIRQTGTAGVALLNISREYQKFGAYIAALKYCHRALALQQKEVGSLPYYLTLVHRSHLFLQTNRMHEAQLDYEEASAADFPEVRAALTVLDKVRNNFTGSTASLEKSMTPTWRSRAAEKEVPQKLGADEDRLIHLLAQNPMDKFELVEALYEKHLSFLILENRLKNLLTRIRKKKPNLIVLEEGKYRISDNVFLPHKIRGAG